MSVMILIEYNKLLIFVDEDVKQAVVYSKKVLDSQLDLVENILNLDIVNKIGE